MLTYFFVMNGEGRVLSGEKLPVFKVEREGEDKNLIIDYTNKHFNPLIEDNELTMREVMSILLKVGAVTTITLMEEINYVYSYDQVRLLNELRNLYIKLTKEYEIFKPQRTGSAYDDKVSNESLLLIKNIILRKYLEDPVGAYLTALRSLRLKKVELQEMKGEEAEAYKVLVNKLELIVKEFETTQLFKLVKKYLPGYKVGDRTVYRTVFKPQIKPNFMYTRLMTQPPSKAREVDLYRVSEDVEVTIYETSDQTKLLYYVTPPEFKLSDDEYAIMTEARSIIAKHKPTKEEFVNPQKMREIFFNIARDLIEQIAGQRGVELKYDRVNKLAEILVRLTIGFGLVEVLLFDKMVEDIYINPPIGSTPILLTHNQYGEMVTNIVPNVHDVRAWASRFRLLSGRPLDEAHPVLDTELELPHASARVAIVQPPLSPQGFGFAFRQHRPKPWTLPLFIKYKMISSMAAGLLWFLVDGARTMLVAGTRGSGKSSLLSSLVTEIMRKYRIITVEDTKELPVNYWQRIGYDVLSIKVRSAISGEENELSAAQGVRTTLRLGDSALIVGEVRGEETLALYEAMRVGALANVVAGTIHGDSPYGVFDRVVNDLGVPRTSFKATDIIMIANKIKSPDGLREYRRLLSVTEVRKDWENDPLAEGAFLDLMRYNPKKDLIEPTRELVEGESEVIKGIAGKVKEWAGDWDAVWSEIETRARVKNLLVEYSERSGDPGLLEADFVANANDAYHKIVQKMVDEVGGVDHKTVLSQYELWLKAKVKQRLRGL